MPVHFHEEDLPDGLQLQAGPIAVATTAAAAIGTIAAKRAFSAEAVVPETVSFIPAATAPVALTPSIETHARLNSLRARLLQ